MERVLIVAKTHISNYKACVGGLTRDTNKSIRLLCPDGSNQPANTPYDVGQVWELEFYPRAEITPPISKMSLSLMKDTWVKVQTYVKPCYKECQSGAAVQQICSMDCLSLKTLMAISINLKVFQIAVQVTGSQKLLSALHGTPINGTTK